MEKHLRSFRGKSIVSTARFWTLSLNIILLTQGVLFALSAYEIDNVFLKVFLSISAVTALWMAVRQFRRQIIMEKLLKKVLDSLDNDTSDVVKSETRRKND